VFLAGGDDSASPAGSPPSEYTGEIFYPPYFNYGFRPTITAADEQFSFNSQSSNNQMKILAVKQAGNTIERVILLRPGSVTHFFDMDQRYIELEIVSAGLVAEKEITVLVKAPKNDLGQPGYYMMFLIEKDTTGRLVPSVAHFIKFS
jgi:hypothetical protein